MFIYTYTIFKSNHNRIIFDKIFNDNIYRIIIINYSIVDEFSLILYHVNFKISFTHLLTSCIPIVRDVKEIIQSAKR